MINLIASDQGQTPLFIQQFGLSQGFWLLAATRPHHNQQSRHRSLRGYLRVSLTAVLTQRLRHQLYTRLIRLPMADLQDMKTGGIQSVCPVMWIAPQTLSTKRSSPIAPTSFAYCSRTIILDRLASHHRFHEPVTGSWPNLSTCHTQNAPGVAPYAQTAR